MPIDPVCVYYAVVAPGGAVLDSGQGTIEEVEAVRLAIRENFPRCTIYLKYPPRMHQPVKDDNHAD